MDINILRNRTWLRMFIMVLFVVVLSACAFSAVDRPDPRKHHASITRYSSVSAPKENAVQAARTAAESIGFKVEFINLALGQIRTDSRNVPIEGFCDCGTWNGSPVQGSANGAFFITVQSAGQDESMVSVEAMFVVNFTAQNLYGATTKAETYECASLGTLEQRFWNVFNALVASVTKN